MLLDFHHKTDMLKVKDEPSDLGEFWDSGIQPWPWKQNSLLKSLFPSWAPSLFNDMVEATSGHYGRQMSTTEVILDN